MDNFKIKSIDEFDLDFVSKYNEKKESEIVSVSSDEPIAEITDNEDINIEYKDTDSNEETFFASEPQDNNSAQEPVAENTLSFEPTNEPTFNEQNNNYKKAKQSAGATAGKVISVILLAATIIVFVLGCFVTIFIDNHGSDIFGYTFNTVSTDTYDSNGTELFSRGDLVISRKAEPSEYVTGEFVIVKSNAAGEEYYSDVHYITSILSVSPERAEITTVNLSSPGIGTATISSDNTYGICLGLGRIPAAGNILHFAMDNAVLTCVLFVLLAAMWCLILVLIENGKSKPKKQK